MVRYLTEEDLATLVGIAKAAAEAKRPEFYAWRNAPECRADARTAAVQSGDCEMRLFHRDSNGVEREIGIEQALAIDTTKLDGAYGERFLLSVAYIIAAVKAGIQVALLQVLDEPGLPFDAAGWIVVSVNGHPMFHIALRDLPMADVDAAGLVTVIAKHTPEAIEHGWKKTNKVQEYGLLLDWLLATPSRS